MLGRRTAASVETAELRFALWRWLLCAVFLLPVLILVTPPLPRASGGLSRAQRIVLTIGQSGKSVKNESQVIEPAASRLTNRENPSATFLLYCAVAVILLTRLTSANQRLGGLARRSASISESSFHHLAHEIWLASGATLRPRIAESDELGVPVTFELLALDLDELWIVLPVSWRSWSDSKLRAALTHEMMHVRRRDTTSSILAALAVCLFWFNPAVWFLQRRLAMLAEEACDELTLPTFTPESYAQILIEFSEDVAAFGGRVLAGTSAVIGSSHIGRRIERLFIAPERLQKRRLVAASILLFSCQPFICPLRHAPTQARRKRAKSTRQRPSIGITAQR